MADSAFRPIDNTREAADAWMTMHAYRRGKGLTVPGIHTPRWASRVTLEVTGVRVERLRDISTGDCWAEGITHSPDVNPRHEYEELWEQIKGPGSWEVNPWARVVAFKRVTP